MHGTPAGQIIITTSLILGVFWGCFAWILAYITGWPASPITLGIVCGAVVTGIAILSLAIVSMAIDASNNLPRP